MSARSRKKRHAHKNKPKQPAGTSPASASPASPASPAPAPSSPPSRPHKPRVDREKRRKDIVFYAAVVVLAGLVVYAMTGGERREPAKPSAALTNPATASAVTSAVTPVETLGPTLAEQPGPKAEMTPPAPPMFTSQLAKAEVTTSTPTNAAGPRILFDLKDYDFGRVKVGEVVKHTYAFTNAGESLLEITDVKPGCGCTTAGQWTRQVPPGGTGSIPIQFRSENFNGPVSKSITVTCNDGAQPVVSLGIKGTVWHPVSVNPRFVSLNIFPDMRTNASAVVQIVNNLEEPITLSDLEVSNPAISVTIRTNEPGKSFELLVEATSPPPSGNAQGQIRLKTSSPETPVINVSAWVYVHQAITVSPTQVTLAQGPSTNQITTSVTIRNNTTNSFTLSEPTVNAEEVGVALREFQPGRFFSITLTFPPGFEIAPTNKVELSVKSSDPQFPVIKVPIVQFARRPSPPLPIASPAPVSGPAE